MMSKGLLEKVAVALSVLIVGGWSVFWIVQVIGVLEILEMAYG